MKLIRPLISGLVVCGIALAMVTSLSAQTAQQGIAKVVRIKGSARYMSSVGTAWQPLKLGAILKPGTVLQTASDSYIDLILNNADAVGASLAPMSMSAAPMDQSGAASYQPKAEKDAVRIFENTVLSIDKLTVDQTGVDVITDTQLDLKAGSIFGTVKKLAVGSKYEVKIPNGVAGIRGTIYYISSSGILRVVSGFVTLAWVHTDGTVTTQNVGAGQQFDIRTGVLSPISPQDLSSLKSNNIQMIHTPGAPVIFIPEPINWVSPTEAKPAPAPNPSQG
jgi:hypothetical protein